MSWCRGGWWCVYLCGALFCCYPCSKRSWTQYEASVYLIVWIGPQVCKDKMPSSNSRGELVWQCLKKVMFVSIWQYSASVLPLAISVLILIKSPSSMWKKWRIQCGMGRVTTQFLVVWGGVVDRFIRQFLYEVMSRPILWSVLECGAHNLVKPSIWIGLRWRIIEYVEEYTWLEFILDLCIRPDRTQSIRLIFLILIAGSWAPYIHVILSYIVSITCTLFSNY